MKRKMILLLLIPLFWNCKQNTKTVTPKVTEVEVEKKVKVPKTLMEIVQFADLDLTDSTAIEALFQYKQIDKNGVVQPISEEEAISTYKELLKAGTAQTLPIFEVKGTNEAVIFITGKGYLGAIWAKLLVDNTSLEVKKIEFGHKSESEGYGDAITYTSFEEQFIGTTIELTNNTFGLMQNGQNILEGKTTIDGLSGATLTSQAVIEMINAGLSAYENYFNKK